MDNISFAHPNGFPLEADATLGFMQNNYVTSGRGLAAAFGNMTIISGLDPNGSSVTDGWIYMGGDLVFFQGGAPDTSFYIETTVVQKANENGVMYDRYYTKKAKFGTHSTLTNYSFSGLKRLHNQSIFQTSFIAALSLESEVILAGCVVSYDSGTGLFDITEGLCLLNGKLITTPSIEGVSVVQYLVVDTTLPNAGKFVTTLPGTPYISFFTGGSSQYYKDVVTRNAAIIGEVRMMAVNPLNFDGTGLGIYKMKGWAISNGANGTYDMRGRMPVGLDTSSVPYTTLGEQGGAESVTISIANLPAHNHQSDNTIGNVNAGEFGLIRRTISGESRTVVSVDATNSGVEPDVVTTPVRLPMQGGDQPISVVSPYTTLLFIQRV